MFSRIGPQVTRNAAYCTVQYSIHRAPLRIPNWNPVRITVGQTENGFLSEIKALKSQDLRADKKI
jgi:hypothetical protein